MSEEMVAAEQQHARGAEWQKMVAGDPYDAGIPS